MFHFLGFLFIIIIAILLIGLSIIGTVIRSVFGLGGAVHRALTGMTTEITNPEGDILLMTDSNQALLPMKSRTQELKKPPHTTDTKNYSPKMKEST